MSDATDATPAQVPDSPDDLIAAWATTTAAADGSTLHRAGMNVAVYAVEAFMTNRDGHPATILQLSVDRSAATQTAWDLIRENGRLLAEIVPDVPCRQPYAATEADREPEHLHPGYALHLWADTGADTCTNGGPDHPPCLMLPGCVVCDADLTDDLRGPGIGLCAHLDEEPNWVATGPDAFTAAGLPAPE